MGIATGTPIWIDLQTADREGARAFYSEVMGWTWERERERAVDERGDYSYARLGDHLVAGEMELPNGAPERALWNVYIKTESSDRATETIRAGGGRVLVEPREVGAYGTVGFYADPTGARFGLWQPGTHAGFRLHSEHGYPCWFEVNTRDAQKARDFYAALGGGLETKKLEGMEYWTVHAEGAPRFGALQMTEEWGEMPPHWMVYFSVDDADAAAEAVKTHGGSLHHGPFDTPFGRIAVVSDPQGATFSMIESTRS